MLPAFCGSPEGLSFSRTSVPVEEAGVVKVRDAMNGTIAVVIQSPCASAVDCATMLPLASRSVTGKLASKYHGPGAWPVTVRGLVTIVLGAGVVTWTPLPVATFDV